MAAKVGYSNVVRELLKKGANPLELKISSLSKAQPWMRLSMLLKILLKIIWLFARKEEKNRTDNSQDIKLIFS